jgi:hypothetical protein
MSARRRIHRCRRTPRCSTGGPTGIANVGPARLAANLGDYLGSPVVGRTVRFDLGADGTAQSYTGTTDQAGTARCAIDPVNSPPPPESIHPKQTEATTQ